VQLIYCLDLSLLYFPTQTPRTRLHFPHPSYSFKISLRQKFKYCILNHSRTDISTSSLWNRRPLKCSPLFRNQFLRCFCAQIFIRRVGPTNATVMIDLRLNILIYLHYSPKRCISVRQHHTPICLSTWQTCIGPEKRNRLPSLLYRYRCPSNQRSNSVCLAHSHAICCRYYQCCLLQVNTMLDLHEPHSFRQKLII